MEEIWRLKSVERIQVFLWELAHGKITCNVNRKRLGFTNIDVCSLCKSAPESLLHLARDYAHVTPTWRSIGGGAAQQSFFLCK